MNKTKFTRILSWILCMVLIAAVALFTFGCIDSNDTTTAGDGQVEAPEKVNFTLIVTDADSKDTTFNLSTDKKTLADALLAEGLIEGEDSQYGLYIKKVNGILADYDVNGAWWGLKVNGTDSLVGASSVEVEEGATYQFVYSK